MEYILIGFFLIWFGFFLIAGLAIALTILASVVLFIIAPFRVLRRRFKR